MKTVKKTIKEAEVSVIDTTLPREETPMGSVESPVAQKLHNLIDTFRRQLQNMVRDPELKDAPDIEDKVMAMVTMIKNLERRENFHINQARKTNRAARFHAPLPPAMESFTSEKELLEDLKKNLNI